MNKHAPNIFSFVKDWLKRGEKNSDIIEPELSRESMTLKEWYTQRDFSTQSTQLQLQTSQEQEDDDPPPHDNTSATLSVVVCSPFFKPISLPGH